MVSCKEKRIEKSRAVPSNKAALAAGGYSALEVAGHIKICRFQRQKNVVRVQ